MGIGAGTQKSPAAFRRRVVALALLASACAAPGPSYGVTGQADDDTAEIQAAIDRGGTVQLPAGVFRVSGLELPPDVSLDGAGREATTIEVTGPVGITVTGRGFEGGTVKEIDTAGSISDITIRGESGTAILYHAAAYFDVRRCTISGFDIGIDQQGSLQSEVHDCKLVDNGTGLRYAAARDTYYGPVLPPNRVLVSWSAFYANGTGIDYSGGQQLIVRDSEFGQNDAAIRVDASDGPGLVASGLWMEGNPSPVIRVTGNANHVLRDSFFAYTEGPIIEGSMVCENVTRLEGGGC